MFAQEVTERGEEVPSMEPLRILPAWTILERGLDQIFGSWENGISFAEYTRLYSVAYNYCVAPVESKSSLISNPFNHGNSMH